jgi:uncharacterized membrane protein
MHVLLDTVSLVLGLMGFGIAHHIFTKKHTGKPLVCPVRSNCNVVIHSDYSKFFSIPVEILGMLYYATVILYHFVHILYPEFLSSTVVLCALTISTIAFLFSMYLTAIQAFVLKQWCVWCLTSAGLSLSIFLLTVFATPIPIAFLLGEHNQFFTILHLAGVAIGVGSATVTDVLFFRFLRDYRISAEESGIMQALSQVIWFALLILVLSGIALFVPSSERLLASGKFLTKMIGIGVLVINGFFLNIIIAPKLAEISFSESNSPELGRLRRLAFACGAISITTWYFVFILGALRGITFPFLPTIAVYLAFFTFAILGSQLAEYLVSKKQFPGIESQ